MHDSTVSRPARLPPIDVARGLALVAMITYHFAWDLAYHGFVAWDVATGPAWHAYAVAIAASFLFISGVGLVLAARGGFDGARHLRRVVRIAAAAGLVSAVTFLAFPDTWVYFGVLHMIALGSLLAVPFLRLPPVVTVAAAVAALALPRIVQGGIFDVPELAFLGLATAVPPSNDFVPVFPWFAAMLAGVAFGRAVAAGLPAIPPTPPASVVGRTLSWFGRHSLAVYLIHQPLLFGLVALAATLLPANPATERRAFTTDCVAACSLGAEACRAYCGCVAGALEGTSYFTVRGGDPAMSAAVMTAANTCRPPETPPP